MCFVLILNFSYEFSSKRFQDGNVLANFNTQKNRIYFLPLIYKKDIQKRHSRDTKGEFHRQFNFGAHNGFLIVQLLSWQVIMIRLKHLHLYLLSARDN